jgi:AraC-like DNA-binding protein
VVSERSYGKHLKARGRYRAAPIKSPTPGVGIFIKHRRTEMNFDLAKYYLVGTDLPIISIAWLLGYREVSAFTRAFKRGTGKTPSRRG